ncbi:Kinesin light chain [Fusarium oxysporum f. sp. raphani]|nr:Kinesin light chain [Fusarium oxysporum f. sp. raphani]
MSSGNRAPFDVLHPDPTADTDGETAQAEVDIVAVHGLGSHVDWSWTWRDKDRPGSSVNWLKDPDMLPRVVPKSRILAYNYESRWHVNAPRTRLQLCGEDLVRNLHAFRKGVQDRPVVFVGHSLGGLVIQHALLFADREEEYRYLPRRTFGFISLGSPFRGTRMHGMANFVASLLFIAGSHRGVLEALGYDNQLLRDKLQEFCRLRESTSMSTCCFFEAYDTDYGRRLGLPGLFRGMVVPEESACVPGWERLQLQTDHLKLNKFSGPNDRSFLAVSRQISTMCRPLKNVTEDRAKLPKHHWMVPFERNEGFVGREDALHLLLDRIPPNANQDACQRTVVEGLGGVGKTQIALEAAYRLRETDPSCAVFWVPAVDGTTFENAYRDIGRLLRVAGLDDDKADVKALVQAALSDGDAGQWLLVIDNADDPELMFGTGGLARYLPRSTKGSILLTTRTREVTERLDMHSAGIIRTTKMRREEAREMLRTRLMEDQMRNTASIDTLLDFLDDLPLAIRQASAYIHKTGISTARYLEYCRSSNATLVKLLSRNFEDRGRYGGIKNPVATTWLISFEHISRDSPRAGEYLRFMCFLAERDIPLSLLPPANDEMEGDEAVGTLEAYGFITRREEGGSMDMHRLVRLAMWNWLVEEGQAKATYDNVVQRLDEVFPFPEHENRGVWTRYMAHVQRVLESDEECDDEEAMSGLLFNVAAAFSIQGKYRAAAALYRETLEVKEKVLGKEHPSTLDSMNNLALVLDSIGEYEEASKMHRETLEVKKKILGKEHPSTLNSMNNLALVLDSMGKYGESEEMHRETLEAMEKVLGKEHPSTLDSMNNLANVLDSMGKYEEAEEMHRETLEVREKVLGKEHPSTLDSMNNLANVLDSMGKYEEAEEMH